MRYLLLIIILICSPAAAQTVNNVTITNMTMFTNPYIFDVPTQTITGYRGTDTAITIPSSIGGVAVLEIGYEAFRQISLTSVVISEGITTIKGNAFYDNSITSLTLPSTITDIQAYAFYRNNLTSVTFPSGITSIGGSAFAENSINTALVIPDSVTTLGTYAFNQNYGCTGITIGTGLTSLPRSAFGNCGNAGGIDTIVIPANVTNIDRNVFYNLDLTDITIGAGVTIYDVDPYSTHQTMGDFGETFIDAYGVGGAGNYTYSGGVWTKS